MTPSAYKVELSLPETLIH